MTLYGQNNGSNNGPETLTVMLENEVRERIVVIFFLEIRESKKIGEGRAGGRKR